MTIESDLLAALTGLVAGRIFPDTAPLSTPRPYITYQQIGGTPISFVEKAVPSKKNGLFQIDVFSSSRMQSASLIIQVEGAIVTAAAFQGEATDMPTSGKDDDLQIYRAFQTFTIWSDR